MNVHAVLLAIAVTLTPLSGFSAVSSEQVVEGNVGVTLSMELVQQPGDTDTDVVFTNLVSDGSSENTINSSVRVSTNASGGLTLTATGNHTNMFRDDNLNSSYDSGEVTMFYALRIIATSTGRFSLNISEQDLGTSAVTIGSTTGSVNDLEVPITYKVIVNPIQEAGNYIMVVTFNVANS